MPYVPKLPHPPPLAQVLLNNGLWSQRLVQALDAKAPAPSESHDQVPGEWVSAFVNACEDMPIAAMLFQVENEQPSQILYCNQACTKLLGVTKNELQGQKSEWFGQTFVQGGSHKILGTLELILKVTVKNPTDGRTSEVWHSWLPILDDAGRLAYGVSMMAESCGGSSPGPTQEKIYQFAALQSLIPRCTTSTIGTSTMDPALQSVAGTVK